MQLTDLEASTDGQRALVGDRRQVDLSFSPPCGYCGRNLDRIVQAREFAGSRFVELACDCGEIDSFEAEGLIGDRRTGQS